MKFVKAIARREGKTGTEILLPIQGNEVIFGKIAARLLQLQQALKRDRIYNLLAVDHHPVSDIIRGANHFTFQLLESNFDISANGHVSLVLMSKDGGRLHWPKMTQAEIEAMSQPKAARSCAGCAGELVDAVAGKECPACQGAHRKSHFQDLDLWSMFKLPDGSRWKKITPTEALCLAGGRKHLAGKSAPIPKDQEVSSL